MDLIPKPDQVVSAASNVAHMVLYGGLADLRPMPRTLIDDGTLREVYHYRPAAKVREQGDPVLLVTPLAAPALCFDLRRGCSVVEHFVTNGRPTYLVEYGQVSFKDRNLGMEHWVEEVVPAAIRAVSEHAGGRPVHVIGWSLGGIFTLLAAADSPDLPIASLTVVGSPVDVTRVPMVAPLRPLLNLNVTQGRGAITRAYQAMGGAPKPLVKWAFQLSSFQKLVTKPLAVAQNLDDADFLAQLEAVDRFMDNMIAYPGRTFGQLYHRFVKGNALVGGEFELDDRTISLADITAPVLVFGGANDGIAPIAAVQGRRTPADRRHRRCASRSSPAVTSACSPAAPRAAPPGRSWTSGSTSGPPTSGTGRPRPRTDGPVDATPSASTRSVATARPGPAPSATEVGNGSPGALVRRCDGAGAYPRARYPSSRRLARPRSLSRTCHRARPDPTLAAGGCRGRASPRAC